MKPVTLFLNENSYTFESACSNKISEDHYEMANRDEGCYSYIHYALGMLDSVPLLGRAISCIEVLIAKVALFFINCFCGSDSVPLRSLQWDETLTASLPDHLKTVMNRALTEAHGHYYDLLEIDLTKFDKEACIALIKCMNSPLMPKITTLVLKITPNQFGSLYRFDRYENKITTISVALGDDLNDQDLDLLSGQCNNASQPPIDEISFQVNCWQSNRNVSDSFTMFLKHFPAGISLNIITEGFNSHDASVAIREFTKRPSYEPKLLSLDFRAPVLDEMIQMPYKAKMSSFKILCPFLKNKDMPWLTDTFENITSMTILHIEKLSDLTKLNHVQSLALRFPADSPYRAAHFRGLALPNLSYLELPGTPKDEALLQAQYPDAGIDCIGPQEQHP